MAAYLLQENPASGLVAIAEENSLDRTNLDELLGYFASTGAAQWIDPYHFVP